MIIGGLQKFSLLDYPEHLSAIIFTQGCNFRCHFCYNPMLVRPKGKIINSAANSDISDTTSAEEGHPPISEDDLLVFLQERQGKLDAVVITGGEPTLHYDLPEFIGKIRQLGYKIKLDTNGTNPEMLEKLLKEKKIDYLAMDIKAPKEKYDKVAGVKTDLEKIMKSVKIIKESGLPYEFRTTIVPGLHEAGDIAKMGEMIKGAGKWFLQSFKSDTELVDEEYAGISALTSIEMERFREEGGRWVENCLLR